MPGNIEFSDLFVGIVLETDIVNRKLAVHIPKLMPAIPETTNYSTLIPTNAGVINVEGVEFNPLTKIKNTIWAFPWNVDFKLPKPGSKVIIYFIDDSPKSVYWYPFNSNGDYEPIDEEKYRRLMSISISGRRVDVFEEDDINIIFPDSFKPVYNEDSAKNKRVDLIYKDDYVVSSTVPQNPYEGMMWYNLTQRAPFIYRDGVFNRVIMEYDITDLRKDLGSLTKMFSGLTLSGRMIFTDDLSNIIKPENDDIVAIDDFRVNTGFHSYKLIDDTSSWIKDDGIYYLRNENRMVEISSGVELTLNAYKYNSSNVTWEAMDGWFNWNVSSTNIELTPITLDANNEYLVREITITDPTITNGATVKFSALDLNDNPIDIGLAFTFSQTGEDISFTTVLDSEGSMIFKNSSVLQTEDNLIISVPDISIAGLFIKGSISATITNGAGTTLGTVAVSGKYRLAQEE
jgi:hypothetical protein